MLGGLWDCSALEEQITKPGQAAGAGGRFPSGGKGDGERLGNTTGGEHPTVGKAKGQLSPGVTLCFMVPSASHGISVA